MSDNRPDQDRSDTGVNLDHPQDIFEQWMNATVEREEPCSDCDRMDRDGACTPYFGKYVSQYNNESECEEPLVGYKIDPKEFEIVLLGEAPGGNETGEMNSLSTDKRVWKDYRELKSIVDNPVGSDSKPLYVQDNEEKKLQIQPMDNGVYGDLEKFFEALSETADSFPTTYYTNTIKCSDVWETGYPDDIVDELQREDDGNGFEQCSEYLIEELRTIDPDVILVFAKGTSHVDETLRRLGVDIEEHDNVTDYLFKNHIVGIDDSDAVVDELTGGETPLETYNSEDPFLESDIYVSYHFSRGFGGKAGPIFNYLKNKHDTSQKKKGPFAYEFATEAVKNIG